MHKFISLTSFLKSRNHENINQIQTVVIADAKDNKIAL